MPWDFLLIFFVLAVLLPWRGVQRLSRFLALPALLPRDRVALYASTIAFQWLLAGIVGWRAWERGLTAAELGLSGGDSAGIWSAAAVGAIFFGALHWLNLRRLGRSANVEQSKAIRLTRKILPQTPAELLPYMALAVTAGICEEYLYRGFVIAALLRPGIPVWAVVLGSAALFGLAHLYQGRAGLAGTLLLGILFGVAKVAYHSLIPVIAWHAAIDVVAGVAGPRYLLRLPGEACGTQE